MKREQKIQLLNSIKTGKKTIQEALPREHIVILIGLDKIIKDENGNVYSKADLSELEKHNDLSIITARDFRKR